MEQKDQIVVLLHGLGGVGKTQIALKFIAESGSRFDYTKDRHIILSFSF